MVSSVFATSKYFVVRKNLYSYQLPVLVLTVTLIRISPRGFSSLSPELLIFKEGKTIVSGTMCPLVRLSPPKTKNRATVKPTAASPSSSSSAVECLKVLHDQHLNRPSYRPSYKIKYGPSGPPMGAKFSSTGDDTMETAMGTLKYFY